MTTAPIRFYADSADTDAVAPLLAGSLVHGVTTNPTILRASNRMVDDIQELHALWTEAGAREIFFQTWGTNAAQLLSNAHRILDLGGNIVVKVPATPTAFPVAARLARNGAPVLITAVYSAAQAVAAAAIGARYIAPYLGRLEDDGRDGLSLIGQMHTLTAGTETHVLAASLRSRAAIVELAERGIRLFTASPKVLWSMVQDDESDRSAAQFEAAASSSP